MRKKEGREEEEEGRGKDDILELEDPEPPCEPPLEPPFPPPLPFRFSNSTTVGIGSGTGIDVDVDVEVLGTSTSRIFSMSIVLVGAFAIRQYRIYWCGYVVPSST